MLNSALENIELECQFNGIVTDILTSYLEERLREDKNSKISVMENIERYEKSKRGMFSGSAGYITPEGEFDFNVLIRSVFFSSKTGYLKFNAGSAITYDAEAEAEYNECMLKTRSIREVLGISF